jgi:hypothetical protein
MNAGAAGRVPALQRKTASGSVLRPTGLNPMRLAQVGLGSGVGLSGNYNNIRFLVRSASKFPLPETPDNYRNLQPPVRSCCLRSLKPFVQKNPSAATNRGEGVSESLANIGSRKHAVFFGPLFFLPPVKAEGRFESTSPIHH